MHKIMRILLSVLLAVSCFAGSAESVHAENPGNSAVQILIGAVSHQAMAGKYYQYEETPDPVWKEVGPEDNWNVHYEDSGSILTLRNLTLTQTSIFQTIPAGESSEVVVCMGIYISTAKPITISLEGTSSITLDNPLQNDSYPNSLYGIYIVGDATVLRDSGAGSGTLNVKTVITANPEDLSCAEAIACLKGTLTIESGTIHAEATGIQNGLGISVYGLSSVYRYQNSGQNSAAEPNIITSISSGSGITKEQGPASPVSNSLFITGGNITASGAAPGKEESANSGSASGIGAFGAAYVSGGSIHAAASGSYLSTGISSAAGVQFSGGDSVLTGVSYADSDGYQYAVYVSRGFQAPFSPKISLISGESVLEAKTSAGSTVTDTGIAEHQHGDEHFTAIGPADNILTDLAAYAHIGVAPVPDEAPASSASGWAPSYEIQFKDCSGRVISDQWVAEGQPAAIPSGYAYAEEELNWVYRSLTVSPAGCIVTGYVVPNTADKG